VDLDDRVAFVVNRFNAMLAADGAELVAMFTRVRDLGVATSLDMTLPDPDGPAGAVNWRALLARVLPLVDLFTPSLEELLYMLAPERWAALCDTVGETDPVEAIAAGLVQDLAAEAAALGAAIVFLKAGRRGGYLRTGALAELRARTSLPLPASDNVAQWLAPLPVEAARFRNACGAGDAAVAGFLTALLQGEDVVTAGRAAMVAGRDSLYGVDAFSGLGAWKEVQDEARRTPWPPPGPASRDRASG